MNREENENGKNKGFIIKVVDGLCVNQEENKFCSINGKKRNQFCPQFDQSTRKCKLSRACDINGVLSNGKVILIKKLGG